VLDKNIDIEYLITQCNLHQDDRDIFKSIRDTETLRVFNKNFYDKQNIERF
jgi:hypothetical protein